ncbi:o-succinylbenzoate synthase [Cecembia calidifontis]|uniref:O-succinylbenzoate synthase n=1 Tax=Cecembia calidifontis TaxID=1187080 RepID=A0A4Q7PAC8_9BACT|nr:o-succinylbenzoate synthase [Cecembia calidifontis]RZS97213.1 o-succinylbenzoate synthase [Cecembia calidifontis]
MATNFHNLKFNYFAHQLKFRFDAGTSRGVLKEKTTFFLCARESGSSQTMGWGEAAPLPKLSIDDVPDFEQQLSHTCIKYSGYEIPRSEVGILDWVNENIPAELPSIRFAFEVALLDLLWDGKKQIFKNDFFEKEKPIPINGLIWMGDKDFMLHQIDKKLAEGYNCIKMKIGAIDFDQECELLRYIRERYSSHEITLRVDANGAFLPEEAMDRLEKLAQFGLHSIEQPIRQGQLEAMAHLCKHTPLPIALDEELIGIHDLKDKKGLLDQIRPQYIILKPTLVGGILASRQWIELAEELGIGWWMTSALESNIGLNAIAQFTSTFDVGMPQGLGTGQLYHNNIDSPLTIEHGFIFYDKNKIWGSIPV